VDSRKSPKFSRSIRIRSFWGSCTDGMRDGTLPDALIFYCGGWLRRCFVSKAARQGADSSQTRTPSTQVLTGRSCHRCKIPPTS
jgi:hypothetical protein